MKRRCTDRELWDIVHPLLIRLETELVGPSELRPVARAIALLRRRISDAIQSIVVLQDYPPEGAGHDINSILRAAYDAYIQAAYILHNRAKAVERAQNYLDYSYIEWHHARRKIDATDSPWAGWLKVSPDRARTEPVNDTGFRKVSQKYELPKDHKNPDGPVRYRTQWYKGNLRQLAEEIGIVYEYDFILWRLHSSVHSGALALERGPGVHSKDAGFYAIRLLVRVLDSVTTLLGTEVKDLETIELLASCRKPLFLEPVVQSATQPPEENSDVS